MITTIISLISAIGLPIASFLISEWIKAKQAGTPAERKQNEINEKIIAHDADAVNAAIADKLRKR